MQPREMIDMGLHRFHGFTEMLAKELASAALLPDARVGTFKQLENYCWIMYI